MLKAFDTMLQSEVSADLAATSGGFEPYRYECACCGEEVYIVAAYSTNVVTHFKHRRGNNDVKCEKFLGQYGEISIDQKQFDLINDTYTAIRAIRLFFANHPLAKDVKIPEHLISGTDIVNY